MPLDALLMAVEGASRLFPPGRQCSMYITGTRRATSACRRVPLDHGMSSFSFEYSVFMKMVSQVWFLCGNVHPLAVDILFPVKPNGNSLKQGFLNFLTGYF